MKTKYKALICDVDGTLILNQKDGMPSKKVISAVQKAKKKLHVGIATSRMYNDAQHILTKLQLIGPSIVHSGGQIRDLTTGKIFIQHIFENNEGREIHQIAQSLNL